MSQLFVDNIKNRTGGAIGAPSGAVVTGVVTATSFNGNVTGAGGINITGIATATSFSGPLTGNVTGNATGITGTPNIGVTDITCNSIINNAGGGATWSIFNTGNATFSGDVTIGGVLTYEDVTNVDSIGIITARSGIIATGIVTATEFDGQTELRSWLFG